jgi:hypothetical protein
MVEQNLSNIAELDIINRDSGDYEWIKFTPDINLNKCEKVHSGGSSDSYILSFIADPKVYMDVKREELFQFLLSKHADELVSTAQACVAKLEEVLMAANHVNLISLQALIPRDS